MSLHQGLLFSQGLPSTRRNSHGRRWGMVPNQGLLPPGDLGHQTELKPTG